MNRKKDQNQDANPSNNVIKAHLNIDGIQRNANRDYYEHNALSSIKTLVMCGSTIELDRMALDNYRMFKYRFGFEPPTRIREQVIAIQQQYDFTDHQIRWLRYSGLLTITPSEAKLVPRRWMFMAGWLQLLVVCLVCSSMLFQVTYPAAIVPAWKQMAGYLIVCGYWAAMAWPLGKLYLESWYVLKRASVIDLA